MERYEILQSYIFFQWLCLVCMQSLLSDADETRMLLQDAGALGLAVTAAVAVMCLVCMLSLITDAAETQILPNKFACGCSCAVALSDAVL